MCKAFLKMTQNIGSEKKGGRKKASIQMPALLDSIQSEIEAHTAGSSVKPNELWTNRSPRKLAHTLQAAGFQICRNTVVRILRHELKLGFRKMQKNLVMKAHPDRDAQFKRIAEFKAEYIEQGWPVVSIDTKKKELLGTFFREGRAWTNGTVRAFDHDFPSFATGKVIPYGVYDVVANNALIYLAEGSDTGELVCDALSKWWSRLGCKRYKKDRKMLVLADSGGSNGYRVKLFHERLCELGKRLQLSIRVAHLPPYCSKYNPIDHRVFCHLSASLRSVLCRTKETIQEAFARTTTSTGLKVFVELANRIYQKGIKASKSFLTDPLIQKDQHLPKFNYTTPTP